MCYLFPVGNLTDNKSHNSLAMTVTNNDRSELERSLRLCFLEAVLRSGWLDGGELKVYLGSGDRECSLLSQER